MRTLKQSSYKATLAVHTGEDMREKENMQHPAARGWPSAPENSKISDGIDELFEEAENRKDSFINPSGRPRLYENYSANIRGGRK